MIKSYPDPGCFGKEKEKIHRAAAPYKKKNSGRAKKDVCSAIECVGGRFSSMRCNRVGGPFGNANGRELQDVGDMSVSPFLTGAVPRNDPCANIVVPSLLRGHDSLVTEIKPHYMRVKDVSVEMAPALAMSCPEAMHATVAPHSAVPRCGCVANGCRHCQELIDCADFEINEQLQETRTATASIHNGARALTQLALTQSDLATSTEAVEVTMTNESKRRDLYDKKESTTSSANATNLTPAFRTRSKASRQEKFVESQVVNCKGETFVFSRYTHDGKCYVKAHLGETRQGAISGGPEFAVDQSDLKSNAFLDAKGRGDDDDVLQPPPADLAESITCSFNNGETFIDALLKTGQCTQVSEVTFGHFDNFHKETEGSLLENKTSYVLGNPSKHVIWSGTDIGVAPVGSLVMPRYKVATVSFSMRDVELHTLHSEIHLSPIGESNNGESIGPNGANLRGAWHINQKGVPVFYPNGFAMLDWTSRNAR